MQRGGEPLTALIPIPLIFNPYDLISFPTIILTLIAQSSLTSFWSSCSTISLCSLNLWGGSACPGCSSLGLGRCSTVDHKQCHKTPASQKVPLWPWWSETKMRPLRHSAWMHTKTKIMMTPQKYSVYLLGQLFPPITALALSHSPTCRKFRRLKYEAPSPLL